MIMDKETSKGQFLKRHVFSFYPPLPMKDLILETTF